MLLYWKAMFSGRLVGAFLVLLLLAVGLIIRESWSPWQSVMRNPAAAQSGQLASADTRDANVPALHLDLKGPQVAEFVDMIKGKTKGQPAPTAPQPAEVVNATPQAAPQANPQPTPQVSPQHPAATPPPAGPHLHALSLYDIEQEIASRTNAERVKAGLKPLLLDQSLVESARKHTIWMSSGGGMRHSQGVAENIAMGQTSPQQVMETWMNSSGHRANILAGHTRLGVAGYRASNGTMFWTQQFR